MNQGSPSVNGLPRGAWADTKTGSHWFIRFRVREAYAGVVHVQPVQRKNDCR